jgi:hypothetical protein
LEDVKDHALYVWVEEEGVWYLEGEVTIAVDGLVWHYLPRSDFRSVVGLDVEADVE